MIGPRLRLVLGMAWIMLRMLWPWVVVAVVCTWLVMR
jgi:hypothetical protein